MATADFLAENRFSAGTDCNTGNTTYELGPENKLTINGPMATTLMFCEGSNETEYFQQLEEIESYLFGEDYNISRRISQLGIKHHIIPQKLYIYSLRKARQLGQIRFLLTFVAPIIKILVTGEVMKTKPSYKMGGHNYQS